MGKRCAYREEDGARCYRNGTGNPPLCRAHSISVIAENEGVDMPDWMQIGIDLLDRQVSQSGDSLIASIRERLGSILAGAANGTAAHASAYEESRRARYEEAQRGYAQSPPPPPPEPESPKEDPRVVLGFSPGVQLTRAKIKERQRALAQLFHPDKSGSTEAMQKVNAAAAELLRMVP